MSINAPVIGGLFFAVIGMIFLFKSVMSLKRAKQSLGWKKIPASLEKLELIRPQSTSANRMLSIKYKYQCENKTYIGDRVAFYTLNGDEIVAFEKKHQSGTEIVIHIDPEQPSQACIVNGLRKSKTYSDILMAILALVIGLLVSIAGLYGVLK